MLAVDGPNFRQATPADIERIVDLDGHSYPAPLSRAERERAITNNPLGGLKDLFVAEIQDEIVAQAFLFPLTTYFGGQPIKTGGVAFVAVAPEARGRGLGSRLMDYIHLRAAKRGAPITMLYAFRHGFYARMGYAIASSRKRLVFDPRSVPKEWRGEVRRPTSRTSLERIFARVARTSSGVHVRPRVQWDRMLARDANVLFECPGGYVVLELRQAEVHAETFAVILELVAETPAARRTLLAAVASLADQTAHVVYEVAEDDPLAQVLLDPDRRRFGTPEVEHGLGELVGGPMVRITHVESALTARGYSSDGAFAIEVDGARHGVRVKSGRATLVAPGRLPVLKTSRAGLAAILYGGMTVRDAVALGVAEDPADGRVNEVLRLPPVTPFDPF